MSPAMWRKPLRSPYKEVQGWESLKEKEIRQREHESEDKRGRKMGKRLDRKIRGERWTNREGEGRKEKGRHSLRDGKIEKWVEMG